MDCWRSGAFHVIVNSTGRQEAPGKDDVTTYTIVLLQLANKHVEEAKMSVTEAAVSKAASGAIRARLQGAEGDTLGNKHTVSVAPSARRCKLPLAHRTLSESVQCGKSRQWEPLTIFQNRHTPRSTKNSKETTTFMLTSTGIHKLKTRCGEYPNSQQL